MFFLSFLKRWWQGRRLPSPTSAPYEVACSCGRSLRGQRQSTAQTISCPGCGRKRFILPSSPWPKRSASGLWSHPAMRLPVPRLNPGRLLLVIIVGGAAAMVLIFLLVKPHLRRPTEREADRPPNVRTRMAAGERQLKEGNAHLALKELNAAIELRDRDPGSLTREEYRRLDQLRRQSDLLAHLLDNPLEDILQQAMQHRDAREWRAKFADYHGRTVVFDDVLRQDAQGRPTLGSYVVRAAEVEARVALEDLVLLRQLPLDPPQRWLFGARLASCEREAGGVWVFRLEPESAVLLTDEAAVTACYPGPVDDELRVLLRRQDERLRH